MSRDLFSHHLQIFLSLPPYVETTEERCQKERTPDSQSLQCKHLSNSMEKWNTVKGFVLWLFTLRPHAKQFNNTEEPKSSAI